MWDLPSPGLEPVSPALAGRFLTTAPPEATQMVFYLRHASLVRWHFPLRRESSFFIGKKQKTKTLLFLCIFLRKLQILTLSIISKMIYEFTENSNQDFQRNLASQFQDLYVKAKWPKILLNTEFKEIVLRKSWHFINYSTEDKVVLAQGSTNQLME